MRISDWSSDVCSSDLVADALRVEEIELHETFDRALPRPLGELHALRDLALDIEGQPVLGAPGEDVEVTAHGEQEVLRARELPQLARREQSRLDQFRHRETGRASGRERVCQSVSISVGAGSFK